MECNDNNLQTTYGLCRCCLEKGHHRDMTKVYGMKGQTEVYSDMFLDCFNVFLSSDLSNLICLSCVDQLRSAWAFKQLVLRTEARLIEELQNSDQERLVVNVPVAKETLNTTVGFKIQVQQKKPTKAPVEEPPDTKVQLCPDTRLPSAISQTCGNQDDHNVEENVLTMEIEMLKTLSGQNGNKTAFEEFESAKVKEEIEEEFVDFEDCADSLPDNANKGFETEHIKVELEEEFMDFDDSVDGSPGYHEFKLKDTMTIHTSQVYGEKELLGRFPRESVQMLPTRLQLDYLCPGYAKHLEELRGKIITARKVQTLLNEPKLPHRYNLSRMRKTMNESIENKSIAYEKPLSERLAHVVNISTLLENSNLTAFMPRYKNGYPCFYCKKVFEKFDVLRTHQLDHSKENLQAMILKRYKNGRPDCVVVYVDVRDLKCALCDVSLNSLTDLKAHLTTEHEKTLYSNYTDRVIPFLIAKKYVCQVCYNAKCDTFAAIARHMNIHYRNYVCEQCDSGFISKQRLKYHTYTTHPARGRFPCDICNKIYTTYRKFKTHNDVVHHLSRKLECNKCSAHFSYTYILQKHQWEVHGETPVIYKCDVCEKSFERKYRLALHIRKEHSIDSDFNCEMCSFTCFSSNELKGHIAKRHPDECLL